MLYLNMVLLGRRHWAGGEASSRHWLHSVVRFVAVVVALVSFTVIHRPAGVSAPTPAPSSCTRSRASRLDLIKNIPADRPVLIQAITAPRSRAMYVEVKADLLGLLKEYEARSGGKIRLNLVPTEVYSTRRATPRSGSGSSRAAFSRTTRASRCRTEVFLGVAFTSGVEEVVIPFFDRGLPVEYELTRSIRVVSKSGRKKVGILSTDAKLMGGMDMRTFSQTPEWSIVTELKKQYDVSSVSPDTPISSDLNVLLVAQPSSLTQRQIDNLTDYIKKGGGALLFLDPFPFDEIPQMSPELPKMPPGGPFGGGQPPEPKGNLRPLLDLIGLDWPSSEIVWNAYNPHPKLADLQSTPEIVFIGKGSGAADAFNPEQSASAGLAGNRGTVSRPAPAQGRWLGARIHPAACGPARPAGRSPGARSSSRDSWGSAESIPRRRHIPTGTSYTLAARINGQNARRDAKTPRTKPRRTRPRKNDAKAAAAPAKINVIAIADLDMIGEQFFELRRRKVEDLEFDNVPFVLNCVDVLAGDESFVGLRRKRPIHRRLDVIEEQVKAFDKELAEKTTSRPRTRPATSCSRRREPSTKKSNRSRTTPSGTSEPRKSSSPICSEWPSAGSTSRSR